MKYYIQEYQIMKYAQNTAGTKARCDISEICRNMGYAEVKIPVKVERKNNFLGMLQLFGDQITNYKNWKNAFKNLKKNDLVLLQFPLISHCLKIGNILRSAKTKGVTVILLVHDMETFRMKKKAKLNFFVRKGFALEEKGATKESSYIILHNKKMIEAAEQMGISKTKLYSLEIFDYLIPKFDEKSVKKRKIGYNLPIIIAGNLRKHKAGYVYHLPDDCSFNLFGVGYDASESDHVKYYGTFEADELPFHLEGSFGLVWDGPEIETCTGLYGEYLKINNPHKTSLYLASDIPVIVWEGAAIAQFVQDNQCGIVVDSINDIKMKLEKITVQEYELFRRKAALIGKRLRSGYYTGQIINEIQSKIQNGATE